MLKLNKNCSKIENHIKLSCVVSYINKLPMESIYLKRFEINNLFNKTESFFLNRAESKKNKNKYSFYIIKRMHSCVKADRKSIDFFFSRIYRVDTFKTLLFKNLLLVGTKSNLLRKLLKRSKLISDYHTLPLHSHLQWENVDVLFAEWDFIGVFSGNQKKVSHLLYSPEYISKLKNEVEARQELKDVINIPPLLEHQIKNEGWYEDKLRVSKNGQFISDQNYLHAQEQLIEVYKFTKKNILFSDYLAELKRKSDKVYGNNKLILQKIYSLLDILLEETVKNLYLPITRCHGDFNKNQLLKYKNAIAIIDWAESEYNIAWHDYIYNKMFNASYAFSKKSPLSKYLHSELNCLISQKSLKILVLIEVALKQHAAFNNQRGYLTKWVAISNTCLEHTSTNLSSKQQKKVLATV